jgi:hypothetical protein
MTGEAPSNSAGAAPEASNKVRKADDVMSVPPKEKTGRMVRMSFRTTTALLWMA